MITWLGEIRAKLANEKIPSILSDFALCSFEYHYAMQPRMMQRQKENNLFNHTSSPMFLQM